MSSALAQRENLPLTFLIVELLKRKNEPVKDIELFNMLKSMVPDVSFAEFNKALMTLEIRGVIEVDLIKKNLRTIRLIA